MACCDHPSPFDTGGPRTSSCSPCAGGSVKDEIVNLDHEEPEEALRHFDEKTGEQRDQVDAARREDLLLRPSGSQD